jgi:hypothetical protein
MATHLSIEELETQRVDSLLRLSGHGATALDVGARGGHNSVRLAERFDRVVALDLVRPTIDHPRVSCIEANAIAMPFADDSFDTVLCSELLEHLPYPALDRVTRELARVARALLVVGVPYKQDIRYGRTTCSTCGAVNPPWGHVNVFDESTLVEMFASLDHAAIELIGSSSDRTNWISARLLDFAGNPYGTYVQEERCVACHKDITGPGRRNAAQKVATKLAIYLQQMQCRLTSETPNWIHIRFEKHQVAASPHRPLSLV